MQGERAQLIDIAKGIGIILVALGHFLEIGFMHRPDGQFSHVAFFPWQFIYSFHMPLFFFLAGFTSKSLSKRAFEDVLRSSLTLMVLAVAIHLAAGMADLAFLHGDPGFSPADYLGSLALGAATGSGLKTIVIWFLVALAVIRVLAFALLRFASPQLAVLIGAGLCVGSIAFGSTELRNVFQYKAIFGGLPFFVAGLFVSLGQLQRLSRFYWFVPAIPAAIVLLSINLLNCNAETCPGELGGYSGVLLATGKYGNPALFAINACLGIYLALVVAEALGTTRAADWFQALGARTISILIVNGVMLQYVNPVLKGSIELQSIYEMALFLLLLVPSLVIANIAIAWACEGPITSLRRFSQRLADRLMVAIFLLVPAWTGASVAERNLSLPRSKAP